MTTVKEGSVWGSLNDKFRVLSVIELEGNMWVHYRQDFGIKVPATECRTYSCYLESFIHRFNPVLQ